MLIDMPKRSRLRKKPVGKDWWKVPSVQMRSDRAPLGIFHSTSGVTVLLTAGEFGKARGRAKKHGYD